jgi:hypothetical protein
MTAMNRVVFVLAAAALGACAFDPRGQSVSPDASDDQDAADPDATSDPDAADPDATPDPDAGAGPDATPDPDAGTGPDAGPLTGRMMIDDTAADFGRDGPTYVETRVEAAGAVAPRAYYQGSLCAGGSNSRLFDDGTTATWAVIPATPSKYGLSRTVDLNLPSGGFPAGVGITDGGDWTLWWFGELYLTAGAHNLDLAADDHAFLELAPPGSDSFTTVLGTNVGTVDTATYNAPTTGWYGVRMALAQRGGGVDLYPRLDGVTISRWLTRCRVDAISGLALTGWDEARWNDVRGTTIASADAANVDWGFNRPGDLGITANDTFAVRWAGQFFIATGGTYRLQVESDDGYRLWIDGQAIISNLGDGIFDVTTGDLTLATGWHDVVYDTTESALGAKSRLSIASGPDGAGPFPAARLRPAEGRAERFESATVGGTNAGGTAVFTLDTPNGAVVTGVDTGYLIDVPGGGANITTTLRSMGDNTQLESRFRFDGVERFAPTAFTGDALTATWGLSFMSNNGGSLPESWLTVRFRDDDLGPTPTTATFVSSVRDLLTTGDTAVAALTAIQFTVRAAAGANVMIAVRTCDTPSGCDAAPWSGELASGASLAAVPARRYLQYRLTFTTDGDHEPAVERVQLDYQTR